MQINKIQNISLGRKTNLLNQTFGQRKITLNSADMAQDSFEIGSENAVAYKKYCSYDGTPIDGDVKIFHKGKRLFCTRKKETAPYGKYLFEYSAKGKVLRKTSFVSGYKFSTTEYDGKGNISKTEYYEISPQNKRSEVTYFQDGALQWTISRNTGKNWENSPDVEITKNTPDGWTKIGVSLPNRTTGGLHLAKPTLKRPLDLYVRPDGTYSVNPFSKDETKEFLSSLHEFKRTILNSQYKDDFCRGEKFIRRLDDAIDYLSKGLVLLNIFTN